MALDAKTWLLEQGFSEGYANEHAAEYTPEVMAKIEAAQMRQADYSREQEKLQKSQTDLEAANQRLNTEMAEWATVQASGGEITKKMQRDLEAAQAKVATLTTRVSNIATQAGIDPRTALEGLETTVAPITPTTPAAVDTSKFISADDYNRAQGELAQLAVTLPGELYALATEHHELFGKPLDTRAISTEIMTRARTRNNAKPLDPRAIWEEMHGVAAKRDSVAKAKYDADIKAAEERGRVAAASESVIPGQTTHTGRHSIVLGARESVIKRPQPESTISGAAAALRSGKYRQPETKPA